MENNKLNKKELLARRNTLKALMDLRLLFINIEKQSIRLALKSIKRDEADYKRFQKDYLELLDEL